MKPTTCLTRERLAHFIAYAFDLPLASAPSGVAFAATQSRRQEGVTSQPGGHFARYLLVPMQQSSLTFAPAADAYINSASASSNYGSSSTLQADSPGVNFLLKFSVTGLNGQAVTSAKIRLYNVNASSKGGDFYRVGDNSWSESTVTWNNAPGADPTLLASLGSVSTNTWYEVDVTSLITGDGTYSLRVSTTSTDGADYSSKEGANPPQLVVTTSGGPTATNTSGPTPTASRTSTPTRTATAGPTPTSQPFLGASFTYDGDGNRVAQTINNVTTYFVGNYYEVTSGTITKYYYAGTQRVAMRKGSTLSYLLGDHLGSTSLTLDSNGNVVAELRYKAWGEVRYMGGSTPTDYTFTGQYSDSYINLLDYGSRRYDPELGRFISPDSIVPLASQGVQAWDRYAYVNNNPLRYTDPTGHKACGDGEGINCETGLLNNPKKNANKGCRQGECLGITRNPCLMRRVTCQLIGTDPAAITPSVIQNSVIDGDEFTGFGPEDPPTVNGQTFIPAYGGRQRGLAIIELLMMGVNAIYYTPGGYSAITGENAQGVIPVVHVNESGINIIPGVLVSNNTGYYLHVGHVSVNDLDMVIADSPLIPSGSVGGVAFADPEIMLTTDVSVVVDFQAIQSNGVMFGYGQIRYNGPNYFPVYGPPPPP